MSNITPHQILNFIGEYFGDSEFTVKEVYTAWGKCPNKKRYTSGSYFGYYTPEIWDLIIDCGYTKSYKSIGSRTETFYKKLK